MRLAVFLMDMKIHTTAPGEVSCALTGKKEREKRVATF